MHWFKLNFGDYLKLTSHLPPLHDGVLLLLFMRYVHGEGPLSRDKAQLYRFAKARTEEERAAVDAVVQEFFAETDDGLVSEYMEDVLTDVLKKSAEARAR